MSTINNLKLWLAAYDDQSSGLSSGTFDVLSYEVTEEVGQIFQIVLRVSSGHHEVNLGKVIGKRAAFSLERPGRASCPFRSWAGIVTKMTHDTAHEGGESTYRIYIMPELARLAYRKNTRVFQHASVPEIVLQILEDDWGFQRKSGGAKGSNKSSNGRAGTTASGGGQQEEEEDTSNLEVRNFDPADKKTFPPKEFRVQYEESDLAFVSRLLEEAGISFYFQHANKPNSKGRSHTKLVLDFEPTKGELRGGGPLAYMGEGRANHFGGGDDFAAFGGLSQEMRTGRVTYRDFDFRRSPDRPLFEAHFVTAEEEMPYEEFHYAPGMFHSEMDSGEDRRAVADTKGVSGFNEALLKPVLQRRLEAIRGPGLYANFLTNALDVNPGTVVSLGEEGGLDHPNPEIGAETKLLVIRTWMHGERAKGEHRVRCDAVPIRDDASYRPPLVTPKPRIPGIQSAIVVGPPDKEVFCDEFGRVRVQFHWDRQHKYGKPVDEKNLEANGSCWVRVAQMWAGGKYGFVAIPRIGHEVLVQFFDGDPDSPVIVGSVHNRTSPQPYSLPEHAVRSVWRGHSSPTAPGANANGYNEIYLDDTKGGEEIHVQAQSTLSTVVKRNESRDVGQFRVTKVGSVDKTDVGETFMLTVGDKNGMMITANNNTVNIQAGGEQGSSITLAGPHIYINAYDELHLHANGKIDISSACNQINIDGSKVNLNCNEPHAAQAQRPLGQANGPNHGANTGPTFVPSGERHMPRAPGALAADVQVAPEVLPSTTLSGADSGALDDVEDTGLGGLARGGGSAPLTGASPLAAAASGAAQSTSGVTGAVTRAAGGIVQGAASTLGSAATRVAAAAVKGEGFKGVGKELGASAVGAALGSGAKAVVGDGLGGKVAEVAGSTAGQVMASGGSGVLKAAAAGAVGVAAGEVVGSAASGILSPSSSSPAPSAAPAPVKAPVAPPPIVSSPPPDVDPTKGTG